MRRMVLIVCFFCLLSGAGCSKKGVNPEAWEQSEDSSYLAARLTVIDSIVKSQWETRTVVQGGLGPGTYMLRGFLAAGPEDNRRILEDFEWLPTELTPEFAGSLDACWSEPKEWFTCEEFNRKAVTASWNGEFYYSPEYSIFYFVMTRN